MLASSEVREGLCLRLRSSMPCRKISSVKGLFLNQFSMIELLSGGSADTHLRFDKVCVFFLSEA